MAEPVQTETPATPATPAERDDATVMAEAYALMQEPSEVEAEPEGNKDEKVELEKKDEKKDEKAEPEKKEEKKDEPVIEEKTPPKADDLVAKEKEIEAATVELQKARAELTKTWRVVQKREAKQEAKSKEIAAAQASHEAVVKEHEARVLAFDKDVEQFLDGDMEAKIRVLQKRAGGADVVKLFQRLSETAAGAPKQDRELVETLKALQDRLDRQEQSFKSQREEEEKARKAAEDKASQARQAKEANDFVRRQLLHIAGLKDAYPAIGEMTAVLGAEGAQEVMYNIGLQMRQRGISYPYDEAARAIAMETSAFLATQAGKDFLASRKPKAAVPATPVATDQPGPGTRTETPGASLSATVTSAPGGRQPDRPLTDEEAKAAWDRVDPDEFMEAFMPPDVWQR